MQSAGHLAEAICSAGPEAARRPTEGAVDTIRPFLRGSDLRRRAVVGAALIGAIAYFAWRGVIRGLGDSGDLAVGYAAGRAWLDGLDPYDAGILVRELTNAGGFDIARSGLLEQLQNVYFPATLPPFALLAPIPWAPAAIAYLLLNVAGVLVVIGGLIRILHWRPTDGRAIALSMFVLALAPVHTTLASGQTAVLATAGLVLAVALEQAGHPRWSGLCYGVATIVKVQIGLPFLAYLVWRRRWIQASVTVAVLAVATSLSVLRMHVAGVPWQASWLSNVTVLSGPGGINDPSTLNPERYSLINLQALLSSIAPGARWVEIASVALVGVAAITFVWVVRRRQDRELLALSFVAVAGLLVTYHRYYDAVLLAFPIAWGIGAVAGSSRREGVVVLLLCADFVLPFQTAFHDLQLDGRVPGWFTASPIWDTVVMTQHVWALVLMAITLLVASANSDPDPGIP